MQARGYPFERLPRVGRGQVAWLRAVARSLPAQPGERLEREASALLGAVLTIRPRAPELLASAQACSGLPDPLCAVQLELVGEAVPRALLLELAPESAAVLVDRVLGGDGRVSALLGRALDELSLGVLGYLSARLCAATEGALRVRALETSRDAALPVLAGARVLVWPLELALDGNALGAARAFVPEATADALQRRSSGSPPIAPRALADLTITLCAHAGRATFTREELDALEPRDVVIPDRCRLVREAGGYAGELELHVLGSRAGFSCRVQGTRLTLEQPARCREGIMTDTKSISTSATVASGVTNSELAADAPIELCLEVARFSLPLRELSALRPGEVLNAGRAIGAAVTLSAGGRPLARGELVDIDGEVGMRVLELVG